jgi:hypothetical protein
MKLKDAGKDPFRVDALAKWICFGAVDDRRGITIRVEDSALERLDPSSRGADHTHVLVAHRDKIFKIAAEKYELGYIESGDIISVTVADVAQLGQGKN